MDITQPMPFTRRELAMMYAMEATDAARLALAAVSAMKDETARRFAFHEASYLRQNALTLAASVGRVDATAVVPALPEALDDALRTHALIDNIGIGDTLPPGRIRRVVQEKVELYHAFDRLWRLYGARIVQARPIIAPMRQAGE